MFSAQMINLWLDDLDEATGRAVPEGWTHVRTVDEAISVLSSQPVQRMSLDHDLGACAECMGGRTVDEWLEASQFQAMPHCAHVGTGYDVCLWMAEKGIWPAERPSVHSANPVGRKRMEGVIERYFPEVSNE